MLFRKVTAVWIPMLKTTTLQWQFCLNMDEFFWTIPSPAVMKLGTHFWKWLDLNKMFCNFFFLIHTFQRWLFAKIFKIPGKWVIENTFTIMKNLPFGIYWTAGTQCDPLHIYQIYNLTSLNVCGSFLKHQTQYLAVPILMAVAVQLLRMSYKLANSRVSDIEDTLSINTW